MVAHEKISLKRLHPVSPPSGSVASGHLALPLKLYLLAVVLPIAFYVGPLYMTLMRLVLLVMVVPLFLGLISGRFGRMIWSDYLFIAHVGWMTLAIGINNPDRLVENVGSTAAEFIGGYLIGRAYIRERAQFTNLCKWLSVLVMIMLPLAIYESQTGHTIVIEIIRRLPGITSFDIVRSDPRLGLERVQGVFAHAIHFGLFCSIAFSLTYVGLDGVYSNSYRIFACTIIGLCTFLSLSSGALLAMVMQAFLIGWFTIFRKYDKRWWLLFGLCVVAYIVVDLLSNRSPIRVFMSYATFSAHNAYWRGIIFEWGVMNIFGSAANNIPASPWVGIGLNNWIRPDFMFSGSMDNFWLVMGVRYGFPGFLLLAAGYLAGVIAIGRRDFTGDVQLLNLRRAWMFTFIGLSFTLSTVHVWTTIYSFVFFIFGAGLWMISALPRTDDDCDTCASVEQQNITANNYSRFPVHKRFQSRPR